MGGEAGPQYQLEPVNFVYHQVVEILLTTGPSIPNVNLTNGDKETALHCAAQYGHTEVVQLLLGAGAEPNIKNSKEETALDLAAQVIHLKGL